MKSKSLKQLIQAAKEILLSIIGAKPKVMCVAHEKRAYERELRAAGHSRAEAVAMVAQRYSNRG